MEGNQMVVIKSKTQHDLTVSIDASRLNKSKMEPCKDLHSSIYEEISTPGNLSCVNSHMDANITIKREKNENNNLLNGELGWQSTNPNSAVSVKALKQKNLGIASVERVEPTDTEEMSCFSGISDPSRICQDEIPSSIPAEDTYEDSRICDSNRDLPEHLSVFAIPLMQMKVLETDESSNTSTNKNYTGRSKNNSKRRRNSAKYARKKTRVMGKGCENCRSKCHLKVSDSQRIRIFEHFWSLEDPVRQWQFIAMHTRTKETERKTTNWQSNRKVTRTYSFDVDGDEVKVCQVMFLTTIGVSEKWVRTLVQALQVENPETNEMELSDEGGITSFDGIPVSPRSCQDQIASLIASEEDTSNRFEEPVCDDTDSCDSNQTLPEHLSDFAIPLLEMEVLETDGKSNTPSNKNWSGKPKDESKLKRGKSSTTKVMGKGCEKCRSKCHLRISEAQRLSIFDHFWTLGSPARQWQFIAMHTRTKETKRKTTNWHSNRKFSRSYYFGVDDGEVKVCQVMFLSTLGISEKWIKTALTKKEQDLFPDRRGKTRKQFCRFKESVLESIKEHINLFERCQDCRGSWDKECLPDNLSLRKMYEFYVQFMAAKQLEETNGTNQKNVLNVATERQYRDVFKKNFSLTFHPPRKGQCERCVVRSNCVGVKGEVKEEMEDHVRNKDAVREMKDSDKVEALKQSSLCLASFDVQRIGIPCGEAAEFYYANKLSVYNFSVFDIGRSQAYCYCWHEEIANRGSNESGSCLKDFVEQRVASGVTEFRFYSDSCTVLKKNKYIFSLWYFLAVKHEITITHRFLENGHTLTEGHVVLSDIERKVRKEPVYSPQKVYTLIQTVKDSKPFIVKEVKQEEVYDLQDLLTDQNWTKESNGNEVKWDDIREVHVTGDSPGFVKFRYDYLSEYRILQVGSPENLINVTDYVFKRIYDDKLPITEAKKKCLIGLCSKNLVPADHQHFYYQLTTTSEAIRK